MKIYSLVIFLSIVSWSIAEGELLKFLIPKMPLVFDDIFIGNISMYYAKINGKKITKRTDNSIFYDVVIPLFFYFLASLWGKKIIHRTFLRRFDI